MDAPFFSIRPVPYADADFPIPFSSVCHSISLNLISAAATFSSRCFTDDVPGIGSITGE